ncbi:MAG: NADH-quinone oxidoreductase subunit M [Anaerolineae bacterium]|nr:NADH-quinone oxidoreductase subunit M [Anaerolineae bacterium]
MILIWLIIILLVGGLLAWLFQRWNVLWSRWISLIALGVDLVLVLVLWGQNLASAELAHSQRWLVQLNLAWIPQFGINFHLALDGLSLLMVALTVFLGFMAVAASWTDIQEQVGFFHFNLMWILAGIVGVFLALDLFLFYFFWEMMLVPMYFLISIWGHENRIYAAVKFFIFTQASGLLILLAILGLYFVHGQNTGVYTFDYMQLLGTSMATPTAMWLMMGFMVAFLVKLPAVPFHSWLPDAHTEAPTAGSVILAGLLLKTGAYGLLRFVLPLFPAAAAAFAPAAMLLGVVGILYGAMLAFAQTDLKRLVAYTSVSHMGFVLLGVFAFNELALQGAVMEIVCHGISTGALFILVGALQERLRTREMSEMGGLWAEVPRMGAVGLVFAMASLGLPGLGNFVAEFLVLLGTYQVNILLTIVATVGLIIAMVYSLWLIQRIFHGPNLAGRTLSDFSIREMAIMTAMIVAIVWLGLYPQPVLNTVKPVLQILTADHRPLTAELLVPMSSYESPQISQLEVPGQEPLDGGDKR